MALRHNFPLCVFRFLRPYGSHLEKIWRGVEKVREMSVNWRRRRKVSSVKGMRVMMSSTRLGGKRCTSGCRFWWRCCSLRMGSTRKSMKSEYIIIRWWWRSGGVLIDAAAAGIADKISSLFTWDLGSWADTTGFLASISATPKIRKEWNYQSGLFYMTSYILIS